MRFERQRNSNNHTAVLRQCYEWKLGPLESLFVDLSITWTSCIIFTDPINLYWPLYVIKVFQWMPWKWFNTIWSHFDQINQLALTKQSVVHWKFNNPETDSFIHFIHFPKLPFSSHTSILSELPFHDTHSIFLYSCSWKLLLAIPTLQNSTGQLLFPLWKQSTSCQVSWSFNVLKRISSKWFFFFFVFIIVPLWSHLSAPGPYQ